MTEVWTNPSIVDDFEVSKEEMKDWRGRPIIVKVAPCKIKVGMSLQKRWLAGVKMLQLRRQGLKFSISTTLKQVSLATVLACAFCCGTLLTLVPQPTHITAHPSQSHTLFFVSDPSQSALAKPISGQPTTLSVSGRLTAIWSASRLRSRQSLTLPVSLLLCWLASQPHFLDNE